MTGSAVSGGADIQSIRIGDEASCELSVTTADVDTFARLSGDTNPLHMDAAAAGALGFARPVAHGMLALSAISRLIGTELPGPGALWVSQELQFVAPVLVGDRLTARVKVTQVSRATGLVVLSTEVVSRETGSPVLTGTAKVKVLEQRTEQASGTPAIGERVALVTGGSRGLGQSIASTLARSGMKVVIQYHERRDSADAVVAAIKDGGGEAAACQADLRRPDSHQRLFDAAASAFGRIDVLVNNATPLMERRPLQDWGWEDFSPYLNVYVGATFQLTKLALPGMKARKYGRIINIAGASVCGAPAAQMIPFVTAKHALAGLTQALAVELGPLGITVNTVAPSMLATDQTAAVGERARLLAASQTPLRRLATLDDVAAAVAFLASDGAAFVTGITLPVTGGEVM